MIEKNRKRRMTGAEVVKEYDLPVVTLINACKSGLPCEDKEGNEYDARTLAFMEIGMGREPVEGEEVIYDGLEHPGKLVLWQGKLYACHFITEKAYFKTKDIETRLSNGLFAQVAPAEEQLITGAEAIESYDLSCQELASLWKNGLRCYDSTKWGYWLYDYYTNGSAEIAFDFRGLSKKLFKAADVEACLKQMESGQETLAEKTSPTTTGSEREQKKTRKHHQTSIREAALIWEVHGSTVKKWLGRKGTPENWPGLECDLLTHKTAAVAYRTSKAAKREARNMSRPSSMGDNDYGDEETDT